jgi:aspartyl-tRNA(Asn)/glutamyl-tRNA(Gln) amidotransferase subunit C
MAFSRDDVEKIALLARLKLSDAEVDQMSHQLGAILDYIEQLQEVNTDGVEPLAHCLPVQNVFREDLVHQSLTPDQALANAPKRVDDFFSVPAVFE